MIAISKLYLINAAKKQPWQDSYEKRLNTEFPLSEDNLPPVLEPPEAGGTVPGPSEIISKMLKSSLEKTEFHQNRAIVISSIFSKEKEDYGNYRGLNLTDYVLKVMERTIEKHIKTAVSVDEILFGFVSGLRTNDSIFIMHQLQDQYLAKEVIYTWLLWI